METRTGVDKQTPGDLKRGEVARHLGKGWEFLINYSVSLHNYKGLYESYVGGERIRDVLEALRKGGHIENFQIDNEAFTTDGRAISYHEGRSAYIKPKAPVSLGSGLPPEPEDRKMSTKLTSW